MSLALLVSSVGCGSGGDRGGAIAEARLSSPEAIERGRALYLDHCALCHGENADGRGVRREALSGKPVSFRSEAWREDAEPERLLAVLERGVPGSSMPAWPSLAANERRDLIAYILSVAGEEGGR